jgi:hypothetical protein
MNPDFLDHTPFDQLTEADLTSLSESAARLGIHSSTEDPYFSADRCVARLMEEYHRHPNLIIAVDYDDILWDYHGKGFTFPRTVRLLRECNELGFRIVIYTHSPDARHPEIRRRLEELGIRAEGINIHLLDLYNAGQGKIFYNWFIDDKAAAWGAYEVLRRVVDLVREELRNGGAPL